MTKTLPYQNFMDVNKKEEIKKKGWVILGGG